MDFNLRWPATTWVAVWFASSLTRAAPQRIRSWICGLNVGRMPSCFTSVDIKLRFQWLSVWLTTLRVVLAWWRQLWHTAIYLDWQISARVCVSLCMGDDLLKPGTTCKTPGLLANIQELLAFWWVFMYFYVLLNCDWEPLAKISELLAKTQDVLANILQKSSTLIR